MNFLKVQFESFNGSLYKSIVGMLLAIAENITLNILKPLENTSNTFSIGPAELWLIVQGRLNLLFISRQNQVDDL